MLNELRDISRALKWIQKQLEEGQPDHHYGKCHLYLIMSGEKRIMGFEE